MSYKYLVVGSGLSGAVVAERIATVLDEKVLVIDKRSHIGGNIYDFKDENGITIHEYGPHAFHTNNKQVWEYLSNFTDWNVYFHRVKAFVDGKVVTIPFNFDTLRELFPQSYAEILEEKLISAFGLNKKISILTLRTTDDKHISALGKYIYDKFYEGYSSKQWGIDPSKLDSAILGRVPVYLSRDDRYFQDKYQGIPINGYTQMIEKMLSHSNIKVKLNTDFKTFKKPDELKKIIYTAPIDEFFDQKYGELSYRSLDFKFYELETEFFQEAAQVNYSENYDFTRITEFKHFNGYKSPKTVIAYEYPMNHVCGENEPYYPILNKENLETYKKYEDETPENVIFLGRLGQYKYLNMDQAVENALEAFNTKINLKP